MSKRSLVLLSGLALLCLLAILVSTFVMDALAPSWYPFVIKRREWSPVPRPPKEPPRFEGRLFFRLVPFGIHRRGLPGISRYIASLVFFYLLSTILLFLFPRRLRVVTKAMTSGDLRRKLRLAAVGMIGVLAALLLASLGFFVFIGLSLLPLLLLGVSIALYVGLVGVSLALGNWIKRRAQLIEESPLLELTIGVLVLFIIGMIPILGWLFIGAAVIFGLGAILSTKFGTGERWSLEEFQTE